MRAADGALTVMVINKTPEPPAWSRWRWPTSCRKAACRSGRLTAANTIARQKDLTATGAAVRLTVPAQSVTLLILPKK